MNNKPEILEAVKALGKALKHAFNAELKFKDAKLNDGTTIVRYDAEKLDVGVAVMAVTEQGAIAIPDGDYTLEDGTMFTIAGGVVSAVTPVEETPEGEATAGKETPAPAAAMNEAKAKSIIESVIREQRFITEDKLAEALAEYNKVKESFATQKAEAETKVATLEKEISTQKENIKQMYSLIEQIAGEPSAAPAEPTKKGFDIKAWRKEYKEDLNRIGKQIN